MKSSEALREARVLIENGTSTFLCVALTTVYGDETHVYKWLKAIFGGTPVDSWLLKNSKEYAAWDNQVTDLKVWMKALRDYRLRWIDSMIAEYEAKGD